MTTQDLDLWKASNQERIEERTELSRTLAANGYADLLVSTRETVSEFGVKEWTLIALLDNQDDDSELVVPNHCWGAAYTLAKADMVDLEEDEDESTLTARKRHDNGVFVRLL